MIDEADLPADDAAPSPTATAGVEAVFEADDTDDGEKIDQADAPDGTKAPVGGTDDGDPDDTSEHDSSSVTP